MVSRDKTNTSSSSSSSSSPRSADYDDTNNITRVARACTNCRKAHRRCDMKRPCSRCIRLNLSNCVDYKAKKRGRKKNTALWRQLSETESLGPGPSSSPPLPSSSSPSSSSSSLSPPLVNKTEAITLANMTHSSFSRSASDPHPPSRSHPPIFHHHHVPPQYQRQHSQQPQQHSQFSNPSPNFSSPTQKYLQNNNSNNNNNNNNNNNTLNNFFNCQSSPQSHQEIQTSQYQHHYQQQNQRSSNFLSHPNPFPTARIRSCQDSKSQDHVPNNHHNNQGNDQKTKIVLHVPQPNISYNSSENSKQLNNWTGQTSHNDQTFNNNDPHRLRHTTDQSNNSSNNQDNNNNSNKIVIKMPSNS